MVLRPSIVLLFLALFQSFFLIGIDDLPLTIDERMRFAVAVHGFALPCIGSSALLGAA